jgi:hypothetical protein
MFSSQFLLLVRLLAVLTVSIASVETICSRSFGAELSRGFPTTNDEKRFLSFLKRKNAAGFPAR